MILTRASFQNAVGWAKTYQPTRHAGHSASRCGGTLFGLGPADRSYLLTVDQEFVWTVIFSCGFEYIVSGKKQGTRVVGYLITDNPVLLRDLESRWAINYSLVDWEKWEQEQIDREQAKRGRPAPVAATVSVHEPKPKRMPRATPLGHALRRAISAALEKLEPSALPEIRKDGLREVQATAAPAISVNSAPSQTVHPELAPVEPAPTKAVPVEATPASVAEAPTAIPEEPPASSAPAAPEPLLFRDLPAPTVRTKPRAKKQTAKSSFPKPPRPKPRPRPTLPLPPELPPPTSAAPDPLPAPPVTPESLAAAVRQTARPRTVAPPSTAPRETANPDPLPAPPPPKPKRRSRTRFLPVGADAARLDYNVFGPWPGALPCANCDRSGFVGTPRQALSTCEACDGRGWNPPPDSPLEIEVLID